MDKNSALATLIALTGNRNVITLHVSVVDFCGDLETALFLEQLLYWTPRSRTGWVAKSYNELYDELRLSRYAIDKAVKLLRIGDEKRPGGKVPILKTMLKKFSGAPTTHYKIDMDALGELWSAWIEIPSAEISKSICGNQQKDMLESTIPSAEISKSICGNQQKDMLESTIPSAEISKSITETTTETTTEKGNTAPSKKESPSKLFQNAMAEHFKITLNPSFKAHLSFLKWAIDEAKITPEMVEYAAQMWEESPELNWHGKRQKSSVSIITFQQEWLRMIEGYGAQTEDESPFDFTLA
jgi:hypothetical protein